MPPLANAMRLVDREQVHLPPFQPFQKVLQYHPLRSHIQHQGEVASYVFAGSEPGLMRLLFETKDRPLYGSARLHATSGMEMLYEFGLFPLGEEGGMPTHCLDLNDYRQALQQAKARWMQAQIRKRDG